MTTFTIAPDFKAALTAKPRLRKAAYGDGYTQRVADGINYNPESWSLTFSARTTSERDAILAFFVARGGTESFTWTSPSGVTGVFVCEEWGYTPDNTATHTVTATFTQVYDL